MYIERIHLGHKLHEIVLDSYTRSPRYLVKTSNPRFIEWTVDFEPGTNGLWTEDRPRD